MGRKKTISLEAPVSDDELDREIVSWTKEFEKTTTTQAVSYTEEIIALFEGLAWDLEVELSEARDRDKAENILLYDETMSKRVREQLGLAGIFTYTQFTNLGLRQKEKIKEIEIPPGFYLPDSLGLFCLLLDKLEVK